MGSINKTTSQQLRHVLLRGKRAKRSKCVFRGGKAGERTEGGVWWANKGSCWREMQGWGFSIHPGGRPWKGVGTMGGGVGGGSVSDGELQPTHRAHAHAHIQTLWGKLTASHKSLSLTAVSDWEAATVAQHLICFFFSFFFACCIFSSSVIDWLTSQFTAIPLGKVQFLQMRSRGVDEGMFTAVSVLTFFTLHDPQASSFSLKFHSGTCYYNTTVQFTTITEIRWIFSPRCS